MQQQSQSLTQPVKTIRAQNIMVVATNLIENKAKATKGHLVRRDKISERVIKKEKRAGRPSFFLRSFSAKSGRPTR